MTELNSMDQAYLAVLITMIHADGEIDDLEMENFCAIVQELLNVPGGAEEVSQLIQSFVSSPISFEDACIRLRALPMSDRVSFVCSAADISLANDEVTIDESEMLSELIDSVFAEPNAGLMSRYLVLRQELNGIEQALGIS